MRDLLDNMPDGHKRFLVSFFDRNPDWPLLGRDRARDLPAVRWREVNLDRAGKETRGAIVRELEALFRAGPN